MTGPRLIETVRDRLAETGSSADVRSVESTLRAVLSERKQPWHPGKGRRAAYAIADELSGLGPIGRFIRDPAITEIMINAPDEVYVERRGRLERVTVGFRTADDVLHLIERVLAPLGLRVDASSPWVDARLQDGSRFHAAVPPVALKGPVVCIRKFSTELWSLSDLVAMGTMSVSMASRLTEAVRDRRNILVSGGAGTGKTTLLGTLARLVGRFERIVTIEDAAELRLGSRHVVALETRPPNLEGRGEVTMRDLVRCALRMRPDRIIVGEVRGLEAFDMLQALGSGHAGSMATVHAKSAADALTRLELLALLAAPGLSAEAVRRQAASAIEIVVHLTRDAAGRRIVNEIAEVAPGETASVRNGSETEVSP